MQKQQNRYLPTPPQDTGFQHLADGVGTNTK